MFRDLLDCCLHDPQWTPADVNRIIAWRGDRQTGSESSSIIVVSLKRADGSPDGYGLLTQSEDYTGHGCQCRSMTARERFLARLLAHLDDDEIMRLIGGPS
jgi:hypothetical protein